MAESKDRWNPEQYERYRDERSQPFFDLMALVEARPAMRVVDLGCGTGELTQALHNTLKASETLGLDSSAAMLAKSERLASSDLHFEQREAQRLAMGVEGERCCNPAAERMSAHELQRA